MTNEVDTAELAHLFCCTTRQIRVLAQRGIAVRLGRGRYDADASTRNCTRHLRAQAERHVGTDPRVDGVAANVQWKQASTALLKARYEREAAKLVAVEAAKLVAVEDVRDMWGRIDRGTRAFAMGLPAKFAAAVPMSAHDCARIEQICRDALEDAALERGYEFGRPDGEIKS